ncbi:MAG TPA: arginine--tRNA ligase [Salinivirgaceae bacterium]|nr:arginine--tRNA ligase [Salinivirgaceae bacterium]
MIDVQKILHSEVEQVLIELYNCNDPKLIQIQPTRKEFKGNYTLVVFPLLKYSKQKPEETGEAIAQLMMKKSKTVAEYNVVKGFLNLTLSVDFWSNILKNIEHNADYGLSLNAKSTNHIMVEFSSPNTNKPLHLGHIRNNLLGFSVSRILAANGNRVTRVNLVNDRGIHICKSMLAWQKFGNGATPQSTGIKGDRFVGDYYVLFENHYKSQIAELMAQGKTEDEAKNEAPIIEEARQMLRNWENRKKEVLDLWKTMNSWVYDGFDDTYKRLGIEFDKTYFESETYKLGKEVVLKNLQSGLLQQDSDGSVWIDLTAEGLDRKLLLRSDGTSVYMTQDIGTAIQRFSEYDLNKHIYVVGNEQNYHFQVLSLVLSKMGYSWANQLQHLSYGMVELPSGKMKSREGTVVDADDLLDEMLSTAREMAQESGKLEGLNEREIADINRIVSLGALKYFILKVDPKKNMLFNPEESIDFNGDTGPFIQYAHARIKSILRKAKEVGAKPELKNYQFNEKEVRLIQLLDSFGGVVGEAAEQLSPAQIANYMFELAREFNQYYHEYQIIKEADKNCRNSRLFLIKTVAQILKNAAWLLGMEMPDKM